MLNNWSTTPLLLAGLWSPPTPLVHEAVVQGVDAALCFTDEDETLQPIKKVTKNSTVSKLPKVDEDLAFRLILESDRNIPSGMLASLETATPVLPDTIPVSQTQPLPQPPTSRSTDSPEELDSQDVLVTRLRLKNSRAPSPAVDEVKVDVAVPSLPATPPCQPERADQSPVQDNPIDVAIVDNPFDNGSGEVEQTDEEVNTFEDLLENYSNLNIVNAVTKSPELSPTEPPPPVSRESSPEEKFELISGNIIQICLILIA